MPYKEMSCRLLDPSSAITCRRTTRISNDRKYGVITCQYQAPVTPGGESKWSEQAYRYDVAVWTEAQAKSHCSKHGGQFEPAAKEKIEKATLPPGKWVKKREVVRLENGSGIFVKE